MTQRLLHNRNLVLASKAVITGYASLLMFITGWSIGHNDGFRSAGMSGRILAGRMLVLMLLGAVFVGVASWLLFWGLRNRKPWSGPMTLFALGAVGVSSFLARSATRSVENVYARRSPYVRTADRISIVVVSLVLVVAGAFVVNELRRRSGTPILADASAQVGE